MCGDPQHSGNNTQETTLSASNVAGLGLRFQVSLPSVADGAPAYLSGVSTSSGTRDLLFVTTRAGHIVALDAHSGLQIWSHQYAAGSCHINNGSTPCYTTSSPAIDPNKLYVYSYGLDGNVHKYQVGDGTEIVTGGWPETTTLKAFDEKGSSALAIATAADATTYLYVANGGYPGDNGDYQGHVTAIKLSDGTQKIFNTLCSDQTVRFVETPGTPDCPHVQSAVWARVGVVYDSVTDRIYFATGNGLYDGNSGGHEWGDSVLAVAPDGTGSAGKPLDAYTPTNFSTLDSADLDLGSTAPALLPAAGYVGRLAVQSGKDSMLRLIDLTNMSGQGGPGHTGGELQLMAVPQGNLVFTPPVVWINPADGSTWFFVANQSGISAVALSLPGGVPTMTTQWSKASAGFTPVIANNVLYYARSGLVQALDPTNGNVLWSDSASMGGVHWESPIVVNGVLYITDESSHLTAYGLPPHITSVSPGSGPLTGGTSVTITGTNLAGASSVTFGGVAASVSTNTATQIVVTAPAHAAGAVDVTVTVPGGGTTAVGAFTYLAPASRVFVSAASGSDANPCSTASPCRTFGRALTLAGSGAEIVVSDSGGYGPVTIDRAITIAAPPGVYAGITASSGSAVTVAAGPSDAVTLRGLTLVGSGGANGISFTSGGPLFVENCTLTGFSVGIGLGVSGSLSVVGSEFRRSTLAGLSVRASSGTASATVDRSSFTRNFDGISVGAGGAVVVRESIASGNTDAAFAALASSGSASLDVEDCLVAGNTPGAGIGGNNAGASVIRVADSVITDNGTGLLQAGGSTVLSRGDNTIEGNGLNTSGTIGPFSPK
jgi:hypothetical protein